MSYLFATPDEQMEMLRVIGVSSLQPLLDQIPRDLQLARPLNLPPALTELELQQHFQQAASASVGVSRRISFQGGGAYDHFVPAVVDEITSRGEFYTAYTPYQAEASQGTLQAFFEYQTLLCQLTGMDVANASLYEGGTAVSEAVFMAMRVTDRHSKIVLAGSIHPEYQAVTRTYLGLKKCEIVVVPPRNGVVDIAEISAAIDERTACLVVQYPNVFGCLEDVAKLCAAAKSRGALAIVSIDPISLGLLNQPGVYGADIVVAEGQSLGTPLQFGGPYLGIMACRQEYVRKMPGRLIGKTIDRTGKTCYVLNLQAREQHIRREKATSNICTNQGLLALRATVYLSLLGKHGLREAAELCCQKAHYAAEQLTKIRGISLMFPDHPFFKEFTLSCSDGAETIAARARQAGFEIGPTFHRLGQGDAQLQREGVLIAVTEQRTKSEIDGLVEAIAKG